MGINAKISNAALVQAHMDAAQTRLDAVKRAEEELIKAQADLDKVRSLDGQGGYAVTVNGVRIDVAVNGGRDNGYAAKLVRGREMIHLGALKAMAALVDDCRKRLAEAQQELSRVVASVIDKTAVRHG